MEKYTVLSVCSFHLFRQIYIFDTLSLPLFYVIRTFRHDVRQGCNAFGLCTLFGFPDPTDLFVVNVQ